MTNRRTFLKKAAAAGAIAGVVTGAKIATASAVSPASGLPIISSPGCWPESYWSESALAKQWPQIYAALDTWKPPAQFQLTGIKVGVSEHAQFIKNLISIRVVGQSAEPMIGSHREILADPAIIVHVPPSWLFDQPTERFAAALHAVLEDGLLWVPRGMTIPSREMLPPGITGPLRWRAEAQVK